MLEKFYFIRELKPPKKNAGRVLLDEEDGTAY
jgi:hypothetical protein